jgi:hypothetical protein
MLRKSILILSISYVLILGACSGGLSPGQQAQIQALRVELDATKKEVAAAEARDAQYVGGLVKAFTTLRVEILKTNEALLQQRILAIESGAKISIQTNATSPDTERAKNLETELAKQEQKLSEALSNANASGGLVGAMAHVSAATEANSLALLRQQYLIAKYGLATLSLSTSNDEVSSLNTQASRNPIVQDDGSVGEQMKFQIISPTLLRKQYAELDYHDSIWFDIKFDAIGLDKPARAIKGSIILTDLFGEQKFAIRWTIETPMAPGDTFTEKGSGFEFNQFKDDHQWVRTTDIKNMKIKFRVDSILYEDGTTREL